MDRRTVSLKQVRKLDERVFTELLKNNCVLMCINENLKKRKQITIKALYNNDREFWLNDSSEWNYFVGAQLIETIVEQLKKYDIELEMRLAIKEKSIDDKINCEYDSLMKINPRERIGALNRALKRIDTVFNSQSSTVDEKNKTLVDVSSYSFLVNKVTLDEVVRLTDKEARLASVEVSRLTEKIISSLTAALSKNLNEYNFMHSLVKNSKGVTLRHMVRTFALTYRFVLYFNDELTNNGLASHLRANFDGKYRKWYKPLLPHIPTEDLSLENVFKGGIRPVPTEDLNTYCAGFLLHDIGKQRYIEYYEGSEDYDSRKVEAHAKTGYRMLLQKTVYSEQIAAIAGYHHEYYGHESGYGYYRELCSLMKLDNKNFRQDSCISYNLEDLQKLNSISYLPVKFLEIVDIFDAITDPERSYKSHLDTFEALKLMKEEFVVSNRKIDLILFELFVSFIQSTGFTI